MFQAFLTPSLTASRDGMLLTCVLTLLRDVLAFDGNRWILGRTGGGFVPLDLVRGAVASASERTYLGDFGQCVNYRTEVVTRPVFFGRKP